MYDAIVVGARCAGSPVAMLLARAGHKVLLLDRAYFPSDTMSTHFIQMPGIARLHKWGVLDRVMATGCPPMSKGILDMDGQSIEADFPSPGPLPGLAAPRRTVLDKILVDAAVEAGAELAQGVMVDSLVRDDGKVVGVQGHSSKASSITERARIVIGADGRNSIVARSVEAEPITHTEALGGGYYSYWSGIECDAAELYIYEGQFAVAFPTNDRLTTLATVLRPNWFYESRRGDPESNVLNALDRLGTLGARVRSGRREHDLIPVSNLPNFIKSPGGPGWALVGDAAYHKDPTPADGIADAFRGADLLAASVDDFLSERLSEDSAMAKYREELIDAAQPLLDKTLTMSSFDKSSVERGTAFLEIQQSHIEEAEHVLNNSEKESVMP